jgi:hypothetical protein
MCSSQLDVVGSTKIARSNHFLAQLLSLSPDPVKIRDHVKAAIPIKFRSF